MSTFIDGIIEMLQSPRMYETDIIFRHVMVVLQYPEYKEYRSNIQELALKLTIFSPSQRKQIKKPQLFRSPSFSSEDV